jgi:hypothetical protein
MTTEGEQFLNELKHESRFRLERLEEHLKLAKKYEVSEFEMDGLKVKFYPHYSTLGLGSLQPQSVSVSQATDIAETVAAISKTDMPPDHEMLFASTDTFTFEGEDTRKSESQL